MDWSLFDVLDTALANLEQEAQSLEWEGGEGEVLDRLHRQIDRLHQLKREGVILLPRF